MQGGQRVVRHALRTAALVLGASSGVGCFLVPHVPPAPVVQVRCATASVVGLQWTPVSRSWQYRPESYQILRDGAFIGMTADTRFDDTGVGGARSYRYTIRAGNGNGGVADAAPVVVTTSNPGAVGDAPYCRSDSILNMDWDFAHAVRTAPGSDLWPATWGADGRVYVFFGDGGGFGGDDHRGRASFGVASIEGGPPPEAANEHNVYGGYEAAYPSTLSGKLRALIAVGTDFYAIGGIYNRNDARFHEGLPIAGSPDRVELLVSRHDAHSWQTTGLIFCNGTAVAVFCPSGFANYGAGNVGARDRYIYLYGGSAAADRRLDAVDGAVSHTAPSRTYLARVGRRRLLDPMDYRYFAGFDARAQPRWSRESKDMVPVFTDRAAASQGCAYCGRAQSLEEAVYVAPLHRYIGMAQGEYLAQTSFYEAAEPWGPWNTVSYDNIDPGTGRGGWGTLGTASGGSLGVHIVNAWTSADGSTLWMVYSSDGVAPAEARFPPAGTALDAFHLVKVKLAVGDH